MSLFYRSVAGRLENCCSLLINFVVPVNYVQNRQISYDELLRPRPKPGDKKCFRRIVHYPEEYTVEPLKTTNLAGRDPVTGRKIVQGLGGGLKHKYHWIDWGRTGPESGPPKIEKVVQIIFDGNRSARVALIACGDELKYYLATENMQPGQLISTSREIPKNPVQPIEGNAHPLGALPEGTLVHNIERLPGHGSRFIHAAGSSAKILRQLENSTVVKMPSKHEFTFDRYCLAVVGRLSNVGWADEKFANVQEWREAGYRPRSGLYQKKTGRFGRKLRKPLQVVIKAAEKPKEAYPLTILGMPSPFARKTMAH